MKNAIKIFCALVLTMLLPLQSSASTFGATSTYSNIRWAMSTNTSAFAGCNLLQLDGSGDLMNGSSFVLSGTLNCPAQGGAYGVVGGMYLDVDGKFNINLLIGSGASLQCLRIVNLSGTCVFSDNSGGRMGTGYLTFMD